jgi:two-component system sensor histidine kinase KdpD
MRPFGFLLTSEPPSRRVGVLVAVGLVALCTLLVYPLKQVAPAVSLGVVYMLAVLVVSITWGVWLGVGTAVLSALAFNYFHLPPVGRFTIRDTENCVALVMIVVSADRRREADLAAEMARLLLRGGRLGEDLPTAAARLSQALGLSSAAIELEAVAGDERRIAFPLREGPRRLGTLLVPSDASEAVLRRLQERIVPSLEGLLSASLEREALLTDVVETAALRRADVVKTALLRAVSHDLRSPLTAISMAGEALGSASIADEERTEMVGIVREETRRLSRLVDNLLDLSRLEAGVAEPRVAWTSVDEVIRSALDDLGVRPDEFTLSIDRDLPLVRADPTQLERAFVNVIENARRHCGGYPVSIRARALRSLGAGDRTPSQASAEQPAYLGSESNAQAGRPVGDRLVVRIVDRGPGIPPAQLERVFQPFYRAGTAQGGHRGSGLGLAIARGFVEANGGRLHVESLPGQGATFVFELPLAREAAAQDADGASRRPNREQVL